MGKIVFQTSSRNERILTSRDRLGGILEERKDSAKIT